MAAHLATDRLRLRPWHLDDAPAAFSVYGHPEVARWLNPVMEQVPDLNAMRLLLRQWIIEDSRALPPAGRWTLELRETGQVIGGAALLPLPPINEDLEISWQLHPDAWGLGYSAEVVRSVASWAAAQHRRDLRGAPGERAGGRRGPHNGMEWVGETEVLRQDHAVFRRPADLGTAGSTVPPGLSDHRRRSGSARTGELHAGRGGGDHAAAHVHRATGPTPGITKLGAAGDSNP